MADLDMSVQNEQEKAHAERMARCVPVARKLLAILNSHIDEVTLGDSNAVQKSLTPVAKEVLQMFLTEDINWHDRNVIFQIALQPLAHLGSAIEASEEISYNKAMTALWGKDTLDVKFSDIDKVLKGDWKFTDLSSEEIKAAVDKE